MAKTAQALGIASFDEKLMRLHIAEIRIPARNQLIFVFQDSRQVRLDWEHTSRSHSWTPEMREVARQRTLQQNQARKENGS
jgi:hypothetical protein